MNIIKIKLETQLFISRIVTQAIISKYSIHPVVYLVWLCANICINNITDTSENYHKNNLNNTIISLLDAFLQWYNGTDFETVDLW